MNLIDDLRKRVNEYSENLSSGTYITDIILDNEAFIVNMNTEAQLYDRGVNNLGVSISDYAPYSEMTIAIKKQKGQPYNRVTLHDEGDFSGSFFVYINDDSFEIKAGDVKTHDLIKKYGRQILGLTDESIKELIWKYIFPELKEITNNIIYGKK